MLNFFANSTTNKDKMTSDNVKNTFGVFVIIGIGIKHLVFVYNSCNNNSSFCYKHKIIGKNFRNDLQKIIILNLISFYTWIWLTWLCHTLSKNILQPGLSYNKLLLSKQASHVFQLCPTNIVELFLVLRPWNLVIR